MLKTLEVMEGVGIREKVRKSRLPARLDLAQSATGLFLALFMWFHMLFVASILLGKNAMYTISRFFEGKYVFGQAYPWLVSCVVGGVFLTFILHAGLGMRKFPNSWRQYKAFRGHMRMMKHDDTSLWFWQAVTGFAMFFLGSAHLYVMLSGPQNIGPFASSERVFSGWFWPLYTVLLVCVELHGGIGLYRLAVKWGWFEGKNPAESRKRLKRVKWAITGFLLALGFLTLAAYLKIGYEIRHERGKRYEPAHITVTVDRVAEVRTGGAQ